MKWQPAKQAHFRRLDDVAAILESPNVSCSPWSGTAAKALSSSASSPGSAVSRSCPANRRSMCGTRRSRDIVGEMIGVDPRGA